MVTEHTYDVENTDRYIGSTAQKKCGTAVPGSVSMRRACCRSASRNIFPNITRDNTAQGATVLHAGIHSQAAGSSRLRDRASGCPGSCSAQGILGGSVSSADLWSTPMSHVRHFKAHWLKTQSYRQIWLGLIIRIQLFGHNWSSL